MAGVVTVGQGVNVSSFSWQEQFTVYLDLLLAGVVTGADVSSVIYQCLLVAGVVTVGAGGECV